MREPSVDSFEGKWLAPYERDGLVLVSLLTMLEHNAVRWFKIAQMLHMVQHPFSDYNEESRKLHLQLLPLLAEECRAIGLTLACPAITRYVEALSERLPSSDEHRGAIADIERRILDEMEATLFLYIPRDRAVYYSDPVLFGPDVMAVFPLIAYDVEEAGKCIATARGTASVFHLMRVMEVLLRHLGRLLGIPYAPSWESYIQQITSKITTKHRKKGIRWKRDEPFFRDVLGDLQGVKIAWRNPTMHVVRKYTLEEAEDVFRAVRAFAQRLAERAASRTTSTAVP